jgi:hypothetical protein
MYLGIMVKYFFFFEIIASNCTGRFFFLRIVSEQPVDK